MVRHLNKPEIKQGKAAPREAFDDRLEQIKV